MWTMTFKKSPIIKIKVYTIGNGRFRIPKYDKSEKYDFELMNCVKIKTGFTHAVIEKDDTLKKRREYFW